MACKASRKSAKVAIQRPELLVERDSGKLIDCQPWMNASSGRAKPIVACAPNAHDLEQRVALPDAVDDARPTTNPKNGCAPIITAVIQAI